jgi:hypothetical protein
MDVGFRYPDLRSNQQILCTSGLHERLIARLLICWDVQHMPDAYHAAILARDGARLASRFLPQRSIWINVLSDDTEATVPSV